MTINYWTIPAVAHDENSWATYIIGVIMKRAGIDDIKIRTRKRNICEARQVAAYLIRKNTLLTFEEIGKMLKLDHTTILYACTQVENLKTNGYFVEKWGDILKMRFKKFYEPINNEEQCAN